MFYFPYGSQTKHTFVQIDLICMYNKCIFGYTFVKIVVFLLTNLFSSMNYSCSNISIIDDLQTQVLTLIVTRIVTLTLIQVITHSCGTPRHLPPVGHNSTACRDGGRGTPDNTGPHTLCSLCIVHLKLSFLSIFL